MSKASSKDPSEIDIKDLSLYKATVESNNKARYEDHIATFEDLNINIGGVHDEFGLETRTGRRATHLAEDILHLDESL